MSLGVVCSHFDTMSAGSVTSDVTFLPRTDKNESAVAFLLPEFRKRAVYGVDVFLSRHGAPWDEAFDPRPVQ